MRLEQACCVETPNEAPFPYSGFLRSSPDDMVFMRRPLRQPHTLFLPTCMLIIDDSWFVQRVGKSFPHRAMPPTVLVPKVEKKLNTRPMPHMGMLLSSTRPLLGSLLCMQSFVAFLALSRILGSSRSIPSILALLNTVGMVPTRVMGTLMVSTREFCMFKLRWPFMTAILLSLERVCTVTPIIALVASRTASARGVQFIHEVASLIPFLGSASEQNLQVPAIALSLSMRLHIGVFTTALLVVVLSIHLSTAQCRVPTGTVTSSSIYSNYCRPPHPRGAPLTLTVLTSTRCEGNDKRVKH